MTPPVIDIACATDDGYAPHTGTMLHSLLAHQPRGSVRVHVLHGRALSRDNRDRLERVVAGSGASLRWLEVGARELEGLPAGRFDIACWYRVLLPTLLPGVGRILYLDSDALVLGELQTLWATDLAGSLFGAVVNPFYPFMPDRPRILGLAGPGEYLNSGVLLMDLERMRATGLVERLRAYARLHPDNPWPEQDALSVVGRGHWRALPPRWNVQTALYDVPAEQLPFPREHVAEAKAHPAIVHFIGPLKPWHYLCRHPLRQLYAQHRRQTPWPQFELEGRTLGNRLLRPLSLEMQLRVRAVMRRLSSLVAAR